MKITKGTIARTLILALALINQILTIFGKSPMPIGDAEIESLVASICTIVTAVIAWWKNNSWSVEARRADQLLKELKGK